MSANFLARPTRPEPVSAPPPIAAAAGAIGRGRSTVARNRTAAAPSTHLCDLGEALGAFPLALIIHETTITQASRRCLSLISHIVRSDLHARCQIDRDCTKEALLALVARCARFPLSPSPSSSSLHHCLPSPHSLAQMTRSATASMCRPGWCARSRCARVPTVGLDGGGAPNV